MDRKNGNVILKIKTLEDMLGIKLHEGINEIPLKITKKVIEAFSSVAELKCIMTIVKAIDNDEYCKFKGFSSFEGKGVKKYSDIAEKYRNSIVGAAKMDWDAFCSNPENNGSEIIFDVDEESFISKRVFLDKYVDKGLIHEATNKLEFYASNGLVSLGVTHSIQGLNYAMDIYLRDGNFLYKAIPFNSMSKLNSKMDGCRIITLNSKIDGCKIITSDSIVFKYIMDVGQVVSLPGIEGANLFYYSERIYKEADVDDDILEFYSFSTGELTGYKSYFKRSKIVKDVTNTVISDFIDICYPDGEICSDLKTIELEKDTYVLKKLGSGNVYLDSEYEYLFHSGSIYHIVSKVDNFCFLLGKDRGNFGEYLYGKLSNMNKYVNITTSVDEFMEKYNNGCKFKIVCHNNKILSKPMEDYVGREASLNGELTKTSRLVGVKGVVKKHYTNRFYVDIEYFGHFTETVKISDLTIY